MKTQLKEPIRVCYILSYRDPRYIRARSQMAALMRCDGIELIPAVNTRKGLFRYFETLWAVLKVKHTKEPDVYILGFRGHEIFWLIRLLVWRKPLIFDALMSPYAALRYENKSGRFGRVLAPVVWWLESSALAHSDLLLTDTQLHVDYFVQAFGLNVDKFIAVPVGAEEAVVENALLAKPDRLFTVLFYGSFLPLHGVEIIVLAAALLKELPIRFEFIGGNKAQIKQFHSLCQQKGVQKYTHRAWVPFDQLIHAEIPNADLCLGGPFGDTPQARRVITTKTSQCLALAKTVVIGAIAEKKGFEDKVNCLLVEQGDPEALAKAICWGFEHKEQLNELGRRGHELYQERLSLKVIAVRLEKAIDQIIIERESA